MGTFFIHSFIHSPIPFKFLITRSLSRNIEYRTCPATTNPASLKSAKAMMRMSFLSFLLLFWLSFGRAGEISLASQWAYTVLAPSIKAHLLPLPLTLHPLLPTAALCPPSPPVPSVPSAPWKRSSHLLSRNKHPLLKFRGHKFSFRWTCCKIICLLLQ